jgi:hypothetical protein
MKALALVLMLSGAAPPAEWVKGEASRLRLELPPPMVGHEDDPGVTRAIIAWGAREVQLKLPGPWLVLGYARGRHAYILAGQNPRGASMPLDRLAYLDDKTGVRTWSRLDDTSWEALTAVASGDGRWVAFVGATAGEVDALEVIDTGDDSVVRVGKPPTPPPQPTLCPHHGRFWWRESDEGFFTPMDAGIITFAADAMTVSYGPDGCRARAAKRRARTWHLSDLFAHAPRIAPKARQ